MSFAAYEPGAGRKPSVDVIIREPFASELAECAALVVSRAGGDVDVRRERLARDLAKDDYYMLVAVVGAEIAGFAQVMHFVAQPDPPSDIAPDGYYLIALIVASDWRRRGIGDDLTYARIAWVAERADEVFYFANAGNGAILDLHGRLGFAEVSRQFTFPGVTFTGGEGVLLKRSIRP
jgi:ribosomal protein S18 acetylase RimI-like enzyme